MSGGVILGLGVILLVIGIYNVRKGRDVWEKREKREVEKK